MGRELVKDRSIIGRWWTLLELWRMSRILTNINAVRYLDCELAGGKSQMGNMLDIFCSIPI